MDYIVDAYLKRQDVDNIEYQIGDGLRRLKAVIDVNHWWKMNGGFHQLSREQVLDVISEKMVAVGLVVDEAVTEDELPV